MVVILIEIVLLSVMAIVFVFFWWKDKKDRRMTIEAAALVTDSLRQARKALEDDGRI